MVKEEQEVIDVSIASEPPTGWIVCGESPTVTIERNGVFKHAGREWDLNRLVQHLVVDFHEQPFGALNVVAEEHVSHETVVGLSDAVRVQLPDTSLLWEAYSETDN